VALARLTPVLDGVVPDLPDVAALFRVLFRLARDGKSLVVIDEFPWLLGTTSTEAERTLSAVQAVMEEERDRSRLKLVLCGSAVAQMEALQSEASPLHGRLVPLELRARICDQMLCPDAPLWNEGRTIVGQDLREPAVHFAVLEQLASGEKQIGELAAALRTGSGPLSKYLSVLANLRLVRKDLPFGASPSERGSHWALSDPFLRFWFRFVFPFQSDLEAGLAPGDLFDREIAPALAGHVAPVFEDLCREHVRVQMGATAGAQRGVRAPHAGLRVFRRLRHGGGVLARLRRPGGHLSPVLHRRCRIVPGPPPGQAVGVRAQGHLARQHRGATGAMRPGYAIQALERLELDLYRPADRVVAVTDAFRGDMIRRGIPEARIRVVPNGIDASDFSSAGSGVRAPRGAGEPFRVGYLGTHGLAHGLDVVFGAAEILRDEGVEFVLVGDGADKPRLLELADHLRLPNVRLLPPVPREQVALTLAGMDAALVPLRDTPTFRNVLPSKIFEAAGARRPILLGVRGEAERLVTGYGAGLPRTLRGWPRPCGGSRASRDCTGSCRRGMGGWLRPTTGRAWRSRCWGTWRSLAGVEGGSPAGRPGGREARGDSRHACPQANLFPSDYGDGPRLPPTLGGIRSGSHSGAPG